jgi:hypothetical protein
MILGAHCHDAYGVVVVTVVNDVVSSRHDVDFDLSSSFYDDEFASASFEATRKKQVSHFGCCSSSSLGAACRGSVDPRKAEARKSRLKK